MTLPTTPEALAVLDEVMNNVLRPNGGAYVEQMEEARAHFAALAEREARLVEAAVGALGAFEALRLIGADKGLPGFKHCEARLNEALAAHQEPQK